MALLGSVCLAVGLGQVIGIHGGDGGNDRASGGGDRGAGGARPTGGAAPAGTATGNGSVRPGPGQSFVTGEVERLSAEGAQLPPLPTPFTFTPSPQGGARATIENALVDGQRTAISWAGGLPLPISGNGGIDLAGARVEVDRAGVTWILGGAPRALLPGRYRVNGPVAVGAAGLAAPRDSIEFQADERTTVNATAGVLVKVPPRRLELEGPGRVTATGRLQVRDADRSRAATSFSFGEGPYKVVLDPGGGRAPTVDALLQGPLTVV